MRLRTDRRENVRDNRFGSAAWAAFGLVCAAGLGPSASAQALPARGNDTTPSQIATLKATVRRVDLDITVTDSNGLPVTGLKREDFEVVEDGAPQAVQTFDVHAADPAESRTSPKVPALPSNTFLNLPTFPVGGAPTVVLYDVLNTSPAERLYGKQEFLSYLRKNPSGSPIAIFGLGDRAYLLQAFTEQSSSPELEKDLGHLVGALQRNRPLTLDGRVAVTLEALTAIGRFLSAIPGRKNLIWYSSSFPQSLSGPMSVNYSEEIRKAADMLNIGHVAVYPVDVRGVRVNPFLGADRRDAFGVIPYAYIAYGNFFSTNDAATRATMETLADATGGHAFYGTNDLQEAMGQAIDDGSTYYSLSYEPTNPKYDGSLRHIKVTLKQPGYTLAYRKTYYADDLNAVARAAADAPVSPLTPALERGTPLDHGLLVEAHLEAAGAPVPATPEQMRVLAQYEAMRGGNRTAGKTITQAPPVMMQQYVVTYALVAHQLEMPASDSGNREASLEFGAIAYDEEGRKLNGLDTRIDDPISADRYAKLLAQGYRVQQPLWIPTAAKTLRLAVRDVTGNRTGSLEIPLPLAKPAEASMDATSAASKPPAK